VSERKNRNLHARNTPVQLLVLYTDFRATIFSVTDGLTDGRTVDRMMPISDHTVYQYDQLKTKLNCKSDIVNSNSLRYKKRHKGFAACNRNSELVCANKQLSTVVASQGDANSSASRSVTEFRGIEFINVI